MGDKMVVGGGRFKLIKKLGAGGAGELHLGDDLKQKDQVAVKMESALSKDPQLQKEYKMYKLFVGGPGIANIRYFGKERQFNIMVMDLLGLNLESWFKQMNKKFTMKTVCMIVLQMLDCIEFIHVKKYIHHDIKPENFMTGTAANERKIFIIDFGTVEPYVDANGKHRQHVKSKALIGTARYASVNTHLGFVSSRADDMETMGYVWIYVAKGVLPWQGITGKDLAERFKKLAEAKQKLTVEELTKGLPQEFLAYMKYVKSLKFEQAPDYKYCKDLFNGLMDAYGYDNDGEFDWLSLPKKEEKKDAKKK